MVPNSGETCRRVRTQGQGLEATGGENSLASLLLHCTRLTLRIPICRWRLPSTPSTVTHTSCQELGSSQTLTLRHADFFIQFVCLLVCLFLDFFVCFFFLLAYVFNLISYHSSNGFPHHALVIFLLFNLLSHGLPKLLRLTLNSLCACAHTSSPPPFFLWVMWPRQAWDVRP